MLSVIRILLRSSYIFAIWIFIEPIEKNFLLSHVHVVMRGIFFSFTDLIILPPIFLMPEWIFLCMIDATHELEIWINNGSGSDMDGYIPEIRVLLALHLWFKCKYGTVQMFVFWNSLFNIYPTNFLVYLISDTYT